MKLIGLDFESHYSQEYSLRKMTTESYINDPQFQIIGVSVGVSGRKPQWYSLPTLDDYRQLLAPLMDHAIVCHNAPFDIGILSFRLGLHPRFTVDTLAMARTWYGNTVRNDLGAVAQRLGLPPKGNEIVNAKGKRLEDFTPEELAAFGAYCVHDTELTLAIFERLMADGYPSSELRRQDIVLRAFTQPTLRLDPETLAKELQQEQERKTALLDPLTGVSKDELMSNDKFAQVLLAHGIEPPTKTNAKGKRTYAFAKSDADFKALLDHEDEDVVALVEARLGVKSTQRETRAKRFIELARRTGGWLPVPLASGRAHTLRLAGWDKINLQNLPRVNKKDPKTGLLRRAIVAPSGSLVCAGDLSQIEARLLAAAAGQTDKVEAFANKRDVYSEQASVIFNRHVDRKANPDDFVAGFIGKAVVLGCLAPETLVLTDRGYVPLVEVKKTDRLWDGVEWVAHEGVVPRGEKEVWQWNGLSATTDHEILTERGWREWSEVVTSPSLFQSAIRLADSPSWSGYGMSAGLGARQGGNPLSGVSVAGQAEWSDRICSRGAHVSATPAPKSPVPRLAKSTGATPTSSPMTHIVSAFSTACRRSLGVARTLVRRITTTTGVEASAYTRAGWWVSRALRAGARFLRISSRFQDGMTQACNLIASTTTGGTSPATYGSYRAARTYSTGAGSPISRRRSMTYDIAFAGPRNRYTVATDAGPLIVHNCGYGLGHFKFAGMIYVGMLGEKGVLFDDAFAQQLGVDVREYVDWLSQREDRMENARRLQPLALTAVQWVTHLACAAKIIGTFRESNPMIEQYWGTCNRAIECMYRGVQFEFGGAQGNLFCTDRHGNTGMLLGPDGTRLLYPELEFDGDTYSCLRYKNNRVQRVKLYGGLITENCLGAGTLVLTHRGTVPIEHVKGDDYLFDGVEWVQHGGVIYKSVQSCLLVDNVCMTPDHKVMDHDGWKEASQVQRPYRPDLRRAYGTAPKPHERREVELGLSLPVRKPGNARGIVGDEGRAQRSHSELWVPAQGASPGDQFHAWDEQAPSLCGLEQHDRPMPSSITPGVPAIRWSWYRGLRAVARAVREFLGGHGTNVPTRVDSRKARQQRGLLPGELCVARLDSTGAQHAGEPADRHTTRAHVAGRSSADQRDRRNDFGAQDRARVAGESVVHPAPQRPTPVYDILNCGPRNRFVVLGATGPLLVHNCTQYLAGRKIGDVMVDLDDGGYRVALQVHDEVACVVPAARAEQAKADMFASMRRRPAWMPDLPLEAEVGVSRSYGEAK